MNTQQKNLFLEIGAHCTFLGFLGVLSLIFTGMFCSLFGLPKEVFFSLLGVLFVLALTASVYCITNKSHTLRDLRK